MESYDDDLIRLLGAFQSTGVEYLIIGGFTTNFHGFLRATGDIDFWVRDSRENRENLIAAFQTLGYGTFEELRRIPLIPGFCDIMLDNGIYADLMNRITGFEVKDFSKCYSNARIVDIEGIQVKYLSFNDHLLSKKQSKRLKDKLDVEQLSVIHQEE